VSLKQEVAQVKQNGMERAASIWAMLESLPQPFDPVNIYKTACSIKCAEFITRIKNTNVYSMMITPLMDFLDTTRTIADDGNEVTKGTIEEGHRCADVFEEAMPFTSKSFNDPKSYAERQHTFDGLIMLAAVKMGKEVPTKVCIDKLQEAAAKVMLVALMMEPEGSE